MRTHRRHAQQHRVAGRIAAAWFTVVVASCSAAARAHADGFPPLPDGLLKAGPFAWPTDNRALFDDLPAYHTGYAANPGLGLPGYTRGCGRQFHEGIDIAPARAARTRTRVTVPATDCDTGDSQRLTFPAWRPRDNVYAVSAGRVAFALDDPRQSNYGRYVVIEHRAPDGTQFVTLYAHLGELSVAAGDRVAAGERIAAMGRTSNEATMRNWLTAFPHVHFEIGRVLQRDPPTPDAGPGPIGGIYNGRNIEGYDPLEFLRKALAPAAPGLAPGSGLD